MDREEEEYESEQRDFQEDDNFMTEGEYLESMGHQESADPGALLANENMAYFEQESQEVDVNLILEDIESRLASSRNGHQHHGLLQPARRQARRARGRRL